MTIFGIALLIFIGVAGIVMLIMQPVFANYTQNYMMRIKYSRNSPGVASVVQVAPKRSPLIELCRTIGNLTLKTFPQLNETGIKQALQEANFRNPDHLAILTGAKVICLSVFTFLVGTSNVPGAIILVVPVAFFAWTLPNYSVLGKAKKRKEDLFRELPTILDLIAVCAKAGLGLLGCIDRVTKDIGETCPILKEELSQMLTDTKVFAHPVRSALTDMAQRCGVEELENLTAALIMAEQKGADISSTLQKQSISLRERIKRKAEEQLSTAPVKMVPVTIFFILPLMLVPTLGPPVMQLMGALQAMTRVH